MKLENVGSVGQLMSATSTLPFPTVATPVESKVVKRLFVRVARVWRLVKSYLSTIARSAEKHISEKELQAMLSARRDVLHKTGETQESITRRELVSYVQQNLAAENLDPQKPALNSVGVFSVVKTNRREPVYNMNVVGQGYYIIQNNQENQIVNQQCDALGYLCEYNYPVHHSKAVKKRRVGGF